jgi:hypothetical protein
MEDKLWQLRGVFKFSPLGGREKMEAVLKSRITSEGKPWGNAATGRQTGL